MIDVLKKKWNIIRKHTKISKEPLFDILNFVLIDSTFFDFNGQVYQQIDGCAMGSSISPTIAKIITNELLAPDGFRLN